MFQHDLKMESAYSLRRQDVEQLLSSFSSHEITLEDRNWPTAEHYVQAKLAGNTKQAEKIISAATAEAAAKLGAKWFPRKVKGWKNLRRVLMSRALYTKCMMYPEVKQALLDTGDAMIVDTSAYDHYWGIGRDQRGDNVFGKVLMDIREKIRSDEKQKDIEK